jgi:hypothetical protein
MTVDLKAEDALLTYLRAECPLFDTYAPAFSDQTETLKLPAIAVASQGGQEEVQGGVGTGTERLTLAVIVRSSGDAIQLEDGTQSQPRTEHASLMESVETALRQSDLAESLTAAAEDFTCAYVYSFSRGPNSVDGRAFVSELRLEIQALPKDLV